MTDDYLALGPGSTKSCLTVVELGRRLARVPNKKFQRHGWRTGPGQMSTDDIDPFNGSGAKLSGGRYNPRNSFATAYIPLTRSVAGAELLRMARVGQNMQAERLLPRFVYRVGISSNKALDLTNPRIRDHLGIGVEQLIGDDVRHPQLIGELAHQLGFEVIIVPSVTGCGNLAVVLGSPAIKGLASQQVEAWFDLKDVPTWHAPPALESGIA